MGFRGYLGSQAIGKQMVVSKNSTSVRTKWSFGKKLRLSRRVRSRDFWS